MSASAGRTKAITTDTGSICLRGVSKAYMEAGGSRCVLESIDLDVASGEFVAIEGPSGSGKSTLLNVIAAIEPVDRGQVQVADVELSSIGEPASTHFRRSHIGIVFQFFNLIPTLTVRENLLLPLHLLKQRDGNRVDELLSKLELPDRADSFPDVLSGGEQQRVGVARAMIHRPSVILADEPTGNLDEKTGEGVMALITDAAREGTTVLMVTHAESAAARADRRLLLRGGRLSG